MKKGATDWDLCLHPFLLMSQIMWLPVMLLWHVLNVTTCGGVFCCYLWTLAGLTASIIRCSLLQGLGVSFFLDDRKAWTVATLFPEMSAFGHQGKCTEFCSLPWGHCSRGVKSAIRDFPSELASTHHLAAPSELPFTACWTPWLCSACVFICSSSSPSKTAYLWFHLHSPFGGCFSWTSVGKCFKCCIFPPFLLFFFTLMT